MSTPDQPPYRIFTCTRCGSVDEIIELPVPFIDPRLYVCDVCQGADEQLVFQPLGRGGMRRYTRHYDPAIARIPYGDPPASDWLSREPNLED